MLSVRADQAILDKLAALLQDEPAQSCIRLREYVLGAG